MSGLYAFAAVLASLSTVTSVPLLRYDACEVSWRLKVATNCSGCARLHCNVGGSYGCSKQRRYTHCPQRSVYHDNVLKHIAGAG